jgi:hypothetical protein
VRRKSQLALLTLGALVAVAMIVAVAGGTMPFAASGASAAGAHKTATLTPASVAKAERTRANLKTMFAGLRRVVIQMRANPATARAFKSTGTNLLPRIAAAEKEIARLDPSALLKLQSSLQQDPKWQQAPTTLSHAVAAFHARGIAKGTLTPLSAISGTGTFTDDCLSAGDPVAEDIAALAANEVQSALQAVALALPGVIALLPGIDGPGPRIIAMIAWGVADGIYLALAQTEAVAVDCQQSAFGNTQQSVLAVDPEGSSTVVPTSTQFSIDRLIAKAGDTQAKVTALESTANTVKSQSDTIDTAVNDLNAVLNDITNRVDEVQTDLQTLQTRVAILQNTEVTILKKADTEITNLGTLQSLQLRIKIEENLAANSSELPMGIFQLPAAYGGYLELVRSIVTDTIAKSATLGTPNAQAASFLGSANAAFAAGHYKAAYKLYAQAYGFAH